MYPTLFGEGMWALPSYFTMVMLGFFVCSLIFRRETERIGWNPVRAIDLMFVLIAASIVGARLAHVLFDGYLTDYYWLCVDPMQLGLSLPNGADCTSSAQCLSAQNAGYDIGAVCNEGKCIPEKDCFRVLKFWSGGLTYYGGLILSLVAAWIFAKKVKWPYLKLADLGSPLIAFGLAFGRLGCFLAGCCFGQKTDMPWGLHFPVHSDAWKLHHELYYDELMAQHAETGVWESLPVHPTQLYELFGALVIAAFLWFYQRKRIKYDGQSTAILLISYGILRFVLEFWRADQRGGYILSTSQWISIPLVIIGIILIIRGHKRGLETSPVQESPESPAQDAPKNTSEDPKPASESSESSATESPKPVQDADSGNSTKSE